ncbi:MAG: hypothetical protein QW432_06740 [Desulfurococcaceae archaeon]
MKTMAISEETWKKLKELKEKMSFQSYNELINALIEKWHLVSLKEELSKVNVDVSYPEARRFLDTIRQGIRSQQQ